MVISATVIQLTGDELTTNLMLQHITVNCIYFLENITIILLATDTNLHYLPYCSDVIIFWSRIDIQNTILIRV